MLPSFIIIGGKKCGTTSLYHYLGLHPEIGTSKEKELRFFSAFHARGLPWYERQFPSQGKICGEASPDYARHPYIAGVPERIHAALPDVRLIYLVRDPIERIVSHHMERLDIMIESRPLERLLRDPVARQEYLCESRYDTQLQQYLRCFDKSQILVDSLENLTQNPESTMKKVLSFIGVEDTDFWSAEFRQGKNASEQKRQLNAMGRVLYPKRMYQALRHLLVPYRFRVGYRRVLKRYFTTPATKPKLPEDLIQLLAKDLRPEVAALVAATGLDVSSWKYCDLYT